MPALIILAVSSARRRGVWMSLRRELAARGTIAQTTHPTMIQVNGNLTIVNAISFTVLDLELCGIISCIAFPISISFKFFATLTATLKNNTSFYF